jgi:hypothetical protein
VIAALAVWSMLGAVVSLQRPRDGRYGLLVRKSRQLRHTDDARALLDIAAQEPALDARRALRSMLPRLHPDGLGADTRPELRRTCNEVLGALIDAERRLGQSVPPRPR